MASEDGAMFRLGFSEAKRVLESRAVRMGLEANNSPSLEVHGLAASAKSDFARLLDVERRVRSGDFSDVATFIERGRHIGSRSKRPILSWVEGMSEINRRFVDGEGGLSFVTSSPPGPGRLCRLPFYPASDGSALSAVYFTPTGATDPYLVRTGIDEAGDDPIINLQIDPPFTSLSQSGARQLVTRPLDYGRFRILGLQTHEQPAYFADNNGSPPVSGAFSLYNWSSPPVITVSNLQTQNGRDLFVTRNDQQLSASTFSILPYESSWAPPGTVLSPGQLQKLTKGASRWSRRSTMYFAGLRDNPVVDIDTPVLLTAQAFVPPWSPDDVTSPSPDTRLVVPFSANLVIELLDDFVLGDIVNPSPSSRAGAQVRVGLRDRGVDASGRPMMEVVAPRYVPQQRVPVKK
jgi:hypothetical protein